MSQIEEPRYRWWRELNRYHWFVLAVAAMGWLFDTMDQQLFVLNRDDAITELIRGRDADLVSATDDVAAREEIASAQRDEIRQWGGWATAIFLIGWGTGGLFFGVLGDRIGRAKTMLLTILVYSLCTGASAFSVGMWDFAFWRFLTGLGVGGEFAVGVALVAEVMPQRARPFALGLLQALSAVGNITAASIGWAMGWLQSNELITTVEVLGVTLTPWRIMFLIGTAPALLAVVIRRNLKEPEKWKAAKAEAGGKQLGSFRELLGTPLYRRRALVGLAMATSGIMGLWGIGFFSPELMRDVFRTELAAQGMSDEKIAAELLSLKGQTLLIQNLAAFFGIYGFSILTFYLGRRPAFAISYIAAMASTILVFSSLDSITDIYWMIPLMGFCQLSLFGGFAIYFPELFPTRLRTTGTSFCYNGARFLAAGAPIVLGWLQANVFSDMDEPIRYAGVTMCGIFLLGLFALFFAPETRDEPLPE